MKKRTKTILKVAGGAALAVGAVYFVAGAGYQRWLGADPPNGPLDKNYWPVTIGHAPGPGDFQGYKAAHPELAGTPQEPINAPWWSYLVGRRSKGAILAFNAV